MRDVRRAGVDQIATSWWGWGSLEDQHLPAILLAARAARLDVAVHIEPYAGRTPASVAADIAHLRELGIVDFYVYGAEATPSSEWAVANAAIDSAARVFAHTGLAGFAAAGGFDGVYTYDVLVYGGPRFARLCEQARRKQLLCAPSVGPGYNALRAVGDARVKPRRHGRTYDGMWRAAIAAGADIVTVTSYNEWHEGTQIEPARARIGFGGYDGAWGLRGAAAEYAYVDRTAFWAQRFSRARSRGGGGS
jgi:glycoprotein endo-alpha-1,2-mannosidase